LVEQLFHNRDRSIDIVVPRNVNETETRGKLRHPDPVERYVHREIADVPAGVPRQGRAATSADPERGPKRFRAVWIDRRGRPPRCGAPPVDRAQLDSQSAAVRALAEPEDNVGLVFLERLDELPFLKAHGKNDFLEPGSRAQLSQDLFRDIVAEFQIGTEAVDENAHANV
jgi:hypothetical protein